MRIYSKRSKRAVRDGKRGSITGLETALTPIIFNYKYYAAGMHAAGSRSFFKHEKARITKKALAKGYRQLLRKVLLSA